ncbi:MAG: DUF2267 domain-containing protein [Candidatus Margulisiibacteriota bacterium]|nr:MAG: hypothetical protein A2X43_05415 [Candidatus Margulisbacteria bacterium GWD2_39_127]OGI04351.1 MAG: hypothetical protein A2X42_07095 [Candidatus Margulisbacteria bacterium GWF2_38_17]OGI07793.1 MAG: hypothetical protein A2X41_07875 [Candidatus Margulisbacteria bacterium GWE2_39_32]PZM84842.1 MAG: DUF2267 domain-containing protein [Candidatus Margulisiibacteriota bacterium]HAR63285.1 DUF2267 domain-containing protein [Candidatus Margulisiibacteriota bacterium]
MDEHGICANTIKTANEWLTFIMNELGWEDKRKSYMALYLVLQALRDQLNTDDAAEFGVQLPMLIRVLYYEGWNTNLKNRRPKRKDFFLSIKEQFKDSKEIKPETVASAVFKLLSNRVSVGEIKDIRKLLPYELRKLWPKEELARYQAA